MTADLGIVDICRRTSTNVLEMDLGQKRVGNFEQDRVSL